ncbi:alpha-L-glutamate ligase-like protein [Mangrovimicrobium sediminis]|uniref:Alpha-L-glutamate ligase-like protein n=1 Tax=Mangrovimicrobium sediminis TaxID=2562682 RepID=A0A4Z0M167_9GAMM|nr:alpha-L-glutamate ligase-like protein [Haliea sp. SAOS-164]TGD73352.1 alpha-L-glutamate ligase-like protein [Haliea sp. SAOS-164]
MFASPAVLRRNGILGMNERNVGLIGKFNPRSRFPLVDDKLQTKKAAQAQGIPVPELYDVVEFQYEVRDVIGRLEPLQSFVIKPTQGSGGKGILVITGRDGEGYVKSSGQVVEAEYVRRHLSNVLAGLHSLGGRNDKAMLEAMIDFDPYLASYSHEGVPDLRVIVFKGVPVMAMMRCATHASDGKANLHQGAVGVGLDIGSGKAVAAVQHGNLCYQHPDTGASFEALEIPGWPQVLELAARCVEMTGMEYLGADIVLDRQRGPTLLELNARPGLSIQVANQAGLRHRLARAREIAAAATDNAQKIELARQAFTVVS